MCDFSAQPNNRPNSLGRNSCKQMCHLSIAAGPQPGGVWDPQAIQDIVNTLFWLYCGVNVSESKIIVMHHKAVYILRNLQLETVIPNRCHLLSLQSTEQFISYATFDLCYLLIVVIHDVLSSPLRVHSMQQIVFSKHIHTIEYQWMRKPCSQFAFPIVTSAQNPAS